jgi:hypothetical protein
MATGLPIYDTKPWYRQFWPWLLISLPGSVVVAGFITLYIANKYSDDLVANQPYKVGLAINRQLEKKQIAEQRGIQASFQFLGTGAERRVEVRISGLNEDETLNLSLSHPLEADLDFDVRLQYGGAGLYIGRLTRNIAPRWHWTLESNGPEPWRLDGTIERSEIGNEPAN